jgi:hypothetical protein
MSATTEHLAPEDGRALSPAEFASTAGLSEADVRELQGYQLLAPGEMDLHAALALREAVRLRADFDLDLFTTGLLAGYIRRVRELERELQQERAHTRAGSAVYTEVSFTSVELHGRAHGR